MEKFLTQEGYEKIKKELEILENEKRREIAQRIKYTASFGDFKENAAYHEAKEAQAFVEGKILELKEIISNAKIIEKTDSNSVKIGSKVVLSSNGEVENYQIVSPEESDIFKGKISYKSPLGSALIGRKKGETLLVDAPQGKTEYQIKGIA